MNGSFWNLKQENIQIMHALHKLIFSSKMAEGVKQKFELVERNCILFYVTIVLREENQAWFELFSKIF